MGICGQNPYKRSYNPTFQLVGANLKSMRRQSTTPQCLTAKAPWKKDGSWNTILSFEEYVNLVRWLAIRRFSDLLQDGYE